MLLRKTSILPAIIILMATVVTAQDHSAAEAITLHIGDAAPAVKYSKWLKGTPVNVYSNDRLYVLEFWATWCGPCIGAMPHLSDMSDKYKDKATFIGVNVWERTGDKPYESSLPNVTRFVNSSANRIRYNIITDNNAQDMANAWLKPAGINSIPTTFIVSKGEIVWIGNPAGLDNVIEPILRDSFDVAAFKKNYEVQAASMSMLNNEMVTIWTTVQDAVKTKDFAKAFQAIDDGINKELLLMVPLKIEKLKILLANFPEAEAMNYAKALLKENNALAKLIAMAICDKDGLSSETYLFAADGFSKALEDAQFSGLYDEMALAYSKAGDIKNAVKAQEKAVILAKAEIKDPQFNGRVFDYDIIEYEETLNKYKKALKN